ncbi:MAG: hypothetical protein H5U07_00480 [Candidatus Aminicenantes bacterium]|nr:hypothetical protein [Candidatus Aminicenantes bacterium]
MARQREKFHWQNDLKKINKLESFLEGRVRNSRVFSVLFIFFLITFCAEALYAQSDEALLNLSVTIPMRFKLEISNSQVSFTRAGLVTEPQAIPADEGVFTLTLKIVGNQTLNVNIWLVANSDLRDESTGYTIPVETISWRAQGPGFSDGQLSKVTPALVAKISSSGIFRGNLYFFFADNPQLFVPGNYQTVVTLLAEAI